MHGVTEGTRRGAKRGVHVQRIAYERSERRIERGTDVWRRITNWHKKCQCSYEQSRLERIHVQTKIAY